MNHGRKYYILRITCEKCGTYIAVREKLNRLGVHCSKCKVWLSGMEWENVCRVAAANRSQALEKFYAAHPTDHRTSGVALAAGNESEIAAGD